MNRRAQLICAWCGPLCAVLFLIGGVFLGQFIPPLADPSDTAAEAARKYAENTDRIRIGGVIASFSMALLLPWGISLAAQTRRTEGAFPALTYVQVASVAVGTVVVVFMVMFWVIAAFRPESYSDETVGVLVDIAYFLFLFTVPPFTIWAFTVGLAIFMDPNQEDPVYPRWAGYLCFCDGLLFGPAMLMAFFKTGPFAWNGLIAMYVPVITFFIWMLTMSVLTIRNVSRGGVYEPDRGTVAAPPARSAAPSMP